MRLVICRAVVRTATPDLIGATAFRKRMLVDPPEHAESGWPSGPTCRTANSALE